MDSKINNVNNVLIKNYLNSLKTKNNSDKIKENSNINGKSFKEILEEKIYDLKFSKHAIEQINKREIAISENDYVKIRNGLIKSKSKGSRESLFIIDGKGFLVSVKNNVVITCFEKNDLKDNLITNIDSVYIV